MQALRLCLKFVKRVKIFEIAEKNRILSFSRKILTKK